MANNTGMTNDIVADIAKLSSRVDGLETASSNAVSVSRIFKVYPGIGIRLNVRVFKQSGLFPGDGVYPSSNLFMGGSTLQGGGY